MVLYNFKHKGNRKIVFINPSLQIKFKQQQQQIAFCKGVNTKNEPSD